MLGAQQPLRTRWSMCLLKRLIKQLDISFHPVLSWLYRLLLLPPANFLLKLGKQNWKCRWALSCTTVFSIAASWKENKEVPSQLSDVAKMQTANWISIHSFSSWVIVFPLSCGVVQQKQITTPPYNTPPSDIFESYWLRDFPKWQKSIVYCSATCFFCTTLPAVSSLYCLHYYFLYPATHTNVVQTEWQKVGTGQ